MYNQTASLKLFKEFLREISSQIPAWPLSLFWSLHFQSHFWIKAEASSQHCKAESLHCITSAQSPGAQGHLPQSPSIPAALTSTEGVTRRAQSAHSNTRPRVSLFVTLDAGPWRLIIGLWTFPPAPRENTSYCWESIRTKSELSPRRHFKHGAYFQQRALTWHKGLMANWVTGPGCSCPTLWVWATLYTATKNPPCIEIIPRWLSAAIAREPLPSNIASHCANWPALTHSVPGHLKFCHAWEFNSNQNSGDFRNILYPVFPHLCPDHVSLQVFCYKFLVIISGHLLCQRSFILFS